MREAVSCSVIPMLIGNNKKSRRLARRLFWRFSARSCILDTVRSPHLRFMLSAFFHPLPKTDTDELIILSLERFTVEQGDMTYLLVPCSKKAESFVQKNLTALENSFMIRSYGEMMRSFTQDCDAPYARP